MTTNDHQISGDVKKSLILIVDDMLQNVQVLVGILKQEGFDCIPAMSGH